MNDSVSETAIQTTHIQAVSDYLHDLQNRLCQMLENEDGQAVFKEDVWEHTAGGGGRTRVLVDGAILEKAGANFSHVHGQSLPAAATAKRPELKDAAFQALGVSSVIHPINPYIPTAHMNVRFILVTAPNGKQFWWFGGGFDLTPYYGFEEDCQHWHQTAKVACDPFGDSVYANYKAWCDRYFYLPHRNEPRGIGGLFFDDLNEWGFDQCFAFQRSIGDAFIKAYQPIIARRKQLAFTQAQRDFQAYRRGRYVEFNLLYDRGTLFGLQSGGRTESILMSMPPVAAWHYNWQPTSPSDEATLYQTFLQPRDWV